MADNLTVIQTLKQKFTQSDLKKSPVVLPFKNIILWRHAQAVDVFDNEEAIYDDSGRPLTIKGQYQAKKMASWLREHLPLDTNLQCSPALRAFQTAEALKYKIHVNNALKPSASISQVLLAVSNLTLQNNLLLVGHQPWIGQLAGYLLDTNSQRSSAIMGTEIDIKKGAIWWLRQIESVPGRYQIITVQTPSKL